MTRYSFRNNTINYNSRKHKINVEYGNRKTSKFLPKKKKTKIHINEIPSLALLKVFSFIPLQELFLNVRLVCKYWFELSSNSLLWHTIKAGPDIPIELLLNWLKKSPNLKTLHVYYRLDAGRILRKVHKYNNNIRKIQIHHCWGCETRINLPSGPLCNILLRCPYLDNISLNGSRFISCKFFRLLAKRDLIFEKRTRKIDQKRRPKKIKFSGSAYKKQLREFLKSRLEYNNSRVFVYTSRTSQSNEQREVVVTDPDDIERLIDLINV